MIESNKICLLLLVTVALSSMVRAQDLNFCKPVPDPNNKPKPTLDIYSQFQATIELNKFGVTTILKEYYDGLLNIGIAIQTSIGITSRAYCYYSLNEGLSIINDMCKVFKLNETGTMVDGIFDVQNVDGTIHIKSPLSSLLQNPIFTYVYTGTGDVRGIIVDQWQACYYASQTRTNYKITVSFASSRWPSMKESPVEILIETKVDGSDIVNTESYSVIDYRPFLTIEEEDYFTPSGVYCPGRYNQRQIPKMPEHFRFVLQAATQLGTPDNGLIETFAEEYNYRNKLFKFVHDDKNFVVTDIHDYNTGWSYSISRFSGNCTRSPLTLNVSIDSAVENGVVGLRDPKKFFDFDNLNPQYIGLKRRDGVNNDVYVGKGQLFGLNVVAEWYFLSGSWEASQIWPGMLKDGFQLPVEVKFFLELPFGKQVKYNHFFAFEPRRMDLNDFDISECTHHLEKKHYMFSLKNDLAQIIKSNQNEFIHSLTQVLHQNARVTILRLSRIDLAFDVDQVHVFFTLSEKVESYGPVEIPKDDLPLEEAERTLREAFKGDKIQIEFYDWTKDTSYTVPVIKDSLKQVFYNETITYVINRDMTLQGYSDGTTAIVTIVGAIVGLVVGVLATMFIKYKNIKLPYINN